MRLRSGLTCGQSAVQCVMNVHEPAGVVNLSGV